MLRASEIASKSFDKIRNGYRTDAVDAYLKEVSGEVASLQEENAALEQKLQILADALQKYKQDEDALSLALIEAKNASGTMLRSAETRAKQIEDDAQEESRQITENARLEADRLLAETEERCQSMTSSYETAIADLKNYYDTLYADCTELRKTVMGIYREHLGLLQLLPPAINLPDPPTAQPVYEEPEQVTEELPSEEVLTGESEQSEEAPASEAFFADEPVLEEASAAEEPAEEPMPEFTSLVEDDPVAEETPASPVEDAVPPYLSDAEPEIPVTATRREPLQFGENYDVRGRKHK